MALLVISCKRSKCCTHLAMVVLVDQTGNHIEQVQGQGYLAASCKIRKELLGNPVGNINHR